MNTETREVWIVIGVYKPELVSAEIIESGYASYKPPSWVFRRLVPRKRWFNSRDDAMNMHRECLRRAITASEKRLAKLRKALNEA